MSDTSETPAALDRTLLIVGLVAFLAILGGYVYLSKDKPDPEGIVRMVATLAAIFGLGAVQRRQHKATAAKLDQQTTQLTKITSQTNGELDDRIEQAVVKALVARDAHRSTSQK